MLRRPPTSTRRPRRPKRLRDPASESRALLRRSFVALYGKKDPKEGLRLTEQTRRTATGVSSVLSGLAELHLAEAHAMLGERVLCERALGRAEGSFAAIEVSDVAIELYSPTQFGRLAGSCYLFLGDSREAEGYLQQTAAELRDGSKAQAVVLGNLALARVRLGKLAEASDCLQQAMDVIDRTWGGGGLNVVSAACSELRPDQQIPVVGAVQDRLLSLMMAG